ncbi:MAG TPA: histidine kinase [Sporichthya sp.]|nr:histidine kinase [Sporichthya sp.]
MTRTALAWGPAATSAGLTSVAIAVALGDGVGAGEILNGSTGLQALMALTFPVLGALLLLRRTANRLAWVFTATGVSRGVSLLAEQWARHDYRGEGNWPWAAEMSFVSLMMLFVAPVLAPLLLLWFPDGRLAGGRWCRRIATAAVLLSAVGLLVVLPPAWSERGPALLDNEPSPPLAVVGLSVLVAGTAIGVVVGFWSVITRLRGQDRTVRQQIKWYLLGTFVTLVLNVAGDVAHVWFLNLTGTLFFEAAVLVAVRRYALWDIDRILNRTVVYASLTVALTLVYAGTVVGLGLLFGEMSFGRSASVATATLATAAVAGPLRGAVQARIDRRFDRRTFDAVHRVTAFGEHMMRTAAVPGELEQLLRDVLRDPGLRLLFRCQDGALIDAWGRPVSDAIPGTVFRGPSGESARLVHRTFAPDEQGLFAAVRHHAAGAVAVARLQAELLVQVTAVQESRRRIVEAADAERGRVERDLHDGAQQRLVALALTLRSEQRRHGPELGPEAGRIIELGVAEIRGSIDDLRALAAGLLPGSLVSEGLGPALRELVDRQPDPVRFVRRLDHRHPAEVESTAWFVAAEGLANSMKHAAGSAVSVDAACDGHLLRICVQDDGPGGAGTGPGLTGLCDRVRACAGTLEIDSPPGAGTRLTAVLPCA